MQRGFAHNIQGMPGRLSGKTARPAHAPNNLFSRHDTWTFRFIHLCRLICAHCFFSFWYIFLRARFSSTPNSTKRCAISAGGRWLVQSPKGPDVVCSQSPKGSEVVGPQFPEGPVVTGPQRFLCKKLNCCFAPCAATSEHIMNTHVITIIMIMACHSKNNCLLTHHFLLQITVHWHILTRSLPSSKSTFSQPF